MTDDNKRGFGSENYDEQTAEEAQSMGGQNSHGGGRQSSDQGEKGGQTGEDRGFAGMPEDERSAIASEGGEAAHESGNAHEFDSEEAAEAGSKSSRSE